MVMHKNLEGPAVFEMLNGALEVACREKRVNEERNIKILIAQMHVTKGELQEALEKLKNLLQENPRDFRPYLRQVHDIRMYITLEDVLYLTRLPVVDSAVILVCDMGISASPSRGGPCEGTR
ncbi:unnamed protein product [Cuscuta epithymum]|uniref:Uncharacterized protein n=1 Tax=Cuscuta epithymum TaxID=186058 RepID=A0AAV0G9J1_9ASTE|nr:unnamed protein product [Cuscuta epithymum]